LRNETLGGVLLVVAAALALLWANSPWSSGYTELRDTVIGPAGLHLDLTLGSWAADGLLAIFFFVAGLEVKREFVAGDLRDPRRAALPIAAAMGGIIVPALLYLLINAGSGGDALRGWAIPISTDIAFAVAVLAVISSHLPTSLRTFLLTLAVVDDLIAITIIALFFTANLHAGLLLAALLPLGVFAVLVQRRVRAWWLLLPLAVLTWALVHASGLHATVAGVLLAFTVPVVRSDRAGGPDAGPGLAEHFEHRFRPLSAGVAVPVFAFLSAGVTIGGIAGLRSILADSVAVGVIVGLVVGKTVGVWGATWGVAKLTRAELDENLGWTDVLGLALLSGMGFTVSLLIGELAFGVDSAHGAHAKVAVLAGTLTAAALATVVLRIRDRVHRRICEAEEIDSDADGVPDCYSVGADSLRLPAPADRGGS
jgi:NhaA family Na+:H+ antiporter